MVKVRDGKGWVPDKLGHDKVICLFAIDIRGTEPLRAPFRLIRFRAAELRESRGLAPAYPPS